MKIIFDFRSDTVTRPTLAMRQAMAEAPVGDDVLREDPTVNELESLAANMMCKESALFVPSGTFGNQVCLMTHCQRGNEVIISEQAHIIAHEVGAASVLAGVQLRAINPARGWLEWGEIEPRIRRGEDIHYPCTGLICLENALSNGDVQPLSVMREIYLSAGMLKVPVHLDGARIFNAALALGASAADIASCADSVMFCLSKGLSAPVGSLVVGTREFVEKARKMRKLMGGGMRQAGIIAAAGIIALREMTRRLGEDHRHARILAEIFARNSLFEIDLDRVKINMFFVRFRDTAFRGREDELVERLARVNILTYPPENGWIRFVTHADIPANAIEYFEEHLSQILSSMA